jgi:hypothetical protein
MSSEANNIHDFIRILLKAGWLSEADNSELKQRAENLSEDEDDAEEEFEYWLKSDSCKLQECGKILEIYRNWLDNSSAAIDSNANLGIARSQSTTKPGEKSESAQEQLEQGILKNPPPSDGGKP